MIKENSLTWPKFTPARKEVFLLYPKIPIGMMTDNGFIISVAIESTIIAVYTPCKSVKIICDPRNTKNSIMKKSRSGFVLAIISCLYGEMDRHMPAVRAPISMENPRK